MRSTNEPPPRLSRPHHSRRLPRQPALSCYLLIRPRVALSHLWVVPLHRKAEVHIKVTGVAAVHPAALVVGYLHRVILHPHLESISLSDCRDTLEHHIPLARVAISRLRLARERDAHPAVLVAIPVGKEIPVGAKRIHAVLVGRDFRGGTKRYKERKPRDAQCRDHEYQQ